MSLFIFRALSFLAAFLLFSVQPLTGKQILPLIGGAPQGWLVTLFFFQTTLVGGYALVYAFQRLKGIYAGGIYVVLLALGLAFFSPHAELHVIESATPWGLFAWLWETRGFPIAILSATAPLVQRLFATVSPDNPYRLYAISNAGSFAGLLAYPLLIETTSGLTAQIDLWRAGLATVLPLAALCVYLGRNGQASPKDEGDTTKVPAIRILQWMALAALPASMLSGVTMHVNANIASFPLFWVLPLGLYLLTYIFAFSDRFQPRLDRFGFYFTCAATFFLALTVTESLGRLLFSVWFILALFGAGAYLCHRYLYNLRPHPAQLPLFYLMIAIGGALGGAVNAFVVPAVMDAVLEFQFAVAAAIVLLRPLNALDRNLLGRNAALGIAVLCLAAAGCIFAVPVNYAWAFAVILFTGLMVLSFEPRLAALVFCACVALGTPYAVNSERPVAKVRNYFGAMQIRVSAAGDALVLHHGNTIHGIMPHDPALAKIPVAYYSVSGPAGQAILNAPDGPMAVVGLGTAQTGCYGTDKRPVTFFEIDPDVVAISKTYFHYLANCPPAGGIVIGDARLTLADDKGSYAVILLDAFSSDAIPTHLLTLEALEIYRRRLMPDGILLFHTSNRHLALEDMLAAQAAKLGWIAMSRSHIPDARGPYDAASSWVVLTTSKKNADALALAGWQVAIPAAAPWTDDNFSLLGILRL